jgi:polysaccharide biosynthesis/export protein
MYRLFILLVVVAATGCVQHRQLIHFTPPDAAQKVAMAPPVRIQPDDLLAIGIFATDAAAVAPFTFPSSGNTRQEEHEYLVNQNGAIVVPVLGAVSVAGSNLEQVRDTLEKRLEPFLNAPIVTVRWLNFKCTVLGEVARPAVYTFAEQRVSVIEAIGLAGDLTNYANRKNILIIREQEGMRSFGRLDLQDSRLFESPYFYLQQGDVVYVEPMPQKTAVVNDKTTKALPWVSAGAILVNILILLFR